MKLVLVDFFVSAVIKLVSTISYVIITWVTMMGKISVHQLNFEVRRSKSNVVDNMVASNRVSCTI